MEIEKMWAESSWSILVSICKVFNPTLDEDDHFYESSSIRAESQQKQQAEGSYYQAVKWVQQIQDSPTNEGTVSLRCVMLSRLSLVSPETFCAVLFHSMHNQ